MQHVGELNDKTQYTRQRILTAALSLMLENGGGISITAVCKAVGITRTTLYRYFSDREAILRGVFEEFRSRFEQGLYRAIDQTPEADQRLRVVVAYMNNYSKENGVYHLMDTSSVFIAELIKQSFAQRVALYQEVLAPYFDLVEQINGGMVDRGLVAFMLQNLFASLNMFSKPFMPCDMEQLLAQCCRGMVQV